MGIGDIFLETNVGNKLVLKDVKHVPSVVGTPRAAPEEHRGLMKNSGGSGFDVFGIPSRITGSLPQMLCAKEQ